MSDAKNLNSGLMSGRIRAVSDQSNPLQTKLSLILTDFQGNGNKEGIPIEERDNIIRSALNSPLKINFRGKNYKGHSGAYPIGPITNVYESDIDGQPVLLADAVIWNDLYEGVAEHLKEIFNEGISTSWEIYYRESEQRDGISWLKGCEFAGTCIVDVPAYGPERTKILAIASKMDSMTEQDMSDNDKIDVSALTTKVELQSAALADIYSSVTGNSFDNTDYTLVVAGVRELQDKLNKSVSELETLQTTYTTVLAERDALVLEKEEVAKEKAAAEKKSNRHSALAEIMTDEVFEAKWAQLETMTDELFEMYVSDLKTFKKTSASSKNLPLPEPLGKSKLTPKEIAAQILADRGK